LAIAAALNQVVPIKGLRVGLLVSGGNIDLARFAQLVQGD
jgi:threonine dehydratase